jgi:hypothetical protein
MATTNRPDELLSTNTFEEWRVDFNDLRTMAAEVVTDAAAPSISDTGFQLGTIWVETTTDKPYILVDVAGNATWKAIIPVNGVDELTAAEVTQLKNIDSVTIDNTHWTAVGNMSGTNTGDQAITVTGDVTGSASAAATLNLDLQLGSQVVGTGELADKAVTYTKMQDVTNNRLLGNISGTGLPPEELTDAEVRTFLNVEDGADVHTNHTGHITSVGRGATTLQKEAISDQTAETNWANLDGDDEIIYLDFNGGVGSDLGRMDLSVLADYIENNITLPASFSNFVIRDTDGDDITVSDQEIWRITEGTGIDVNHNVTGASPYQTVVKMADMASYTIKMRNAGTTGASSDVKISGLTTEASPAAGDYLLGEESGGALRKFNVGDFALDSQTITFAGGDVTGSGAIDSSIVLSLAAGSIATADIANNAVDNTKLSDMGSYTIKLRNAGTTGDPQDVKISSLTEELSPASTDWLLGEESGGALRKFGVDNFVNGSITLTGDATGTDTPDTSGNYSIAVSLASGSVGTTELAADAVNGTKIADNSINSEHYVDGSIDAAHLATDSVTAAKIAAGAVGNSELAADAVDGTKIADNSINSEHYVDGSIDAVHLATDSVTATKISAGAVGNSELAADAVENDNIATGTLSDAYVSTAGFTITTQQRVLMNLSSNVTVNLPGTPTAGYRIKLSVHSTNSSICTVNPGTDLIKHIGYSSSDDVEVSAGETIELIALDASTWILV